MYSLVIAKAQSSYRGLVYLWPTRTYLTGNPAAYSCFTPPKVRHASGDDSLHELLNRDRRKQRAPARTLSRGATKFSWKTYDADSASLIACAVCESTRRSL
jgi:hypothetical protein